MICRLIIAVFVLIAPLAQATIFGSVRGVIHDPHHRPVSGAMVMLRSQTSDFGKTANTDNNGEFQFNALPLGEYSLIVVAPGFSQVEQNVVLQSGTEPVLHLALRVAEAKETITVSATPTTLVDRAAIAQTPGAARSNSLAMITDFVPGAYITHDQLHIRGGHQTSWLIDGVPVPNTNIASNLGPQFDPKNVDYM